MQDGAVVQADLEVDGRRWQVSCVSMGNPHALVYSSGDGQQIKVLLVDLSLGPMWSLQQSCMLHVMQVLDLCVLLGTGKPYCICQIPEATVCKLVCHRSGVACRHRVCQRVLPKGLLQSRASA